MRKGRIYLVKAVSSGFTFLPKLGKRLSFDELFEISEAELTRYLPFINAGYLRIVGVENADAAKNDIDKDVDGGVSEKNETRVEPTTAANEQATAISAVDGSVGGVEENSSFEGYQSDETDSEELNNTEQSDKPSRRRKKSSLVDELTNE